MLYEVITIIKSRIGFAFFESPIAESVSDVATIPSGSLNTLSASRVTAIFGSISDFGDIGGFASNRITSYNVCYTKLLRFVISSVDLPQSFLVNPFRTRSVRITSYNVCYTKLLRYD